MQRVNLSRQSESRAVFQSFIPTPAIYNAHSSMSFYQPSRMTLSNVVAPVEPQLCFPFSAPAYGSFDTIHGTVPADPCLASSQSLMIPQHSSNSFMRSDQLYLDLWADTQQLSQPSSPSNSQGDTAGHLHANVFNVDDQPFSGTCFDEMPWAPNSPTDSIPENAYAFTMPQLTSHANRKASTARRKRAAKYVCDMCGASLTAKHNLKSHQNVHLGIKPFCCEICQKGFTAKATYHRHLKTVHRGQV